MMSIKRQLCAGLALALLLSAAGCAPAAEDVPTGTPGRVEDPFARPTPTPTLTPASTPSPAPAPSPSPAQTVLPTSGPSGAEATKAPAGQPSGPSNRSISMGFGILGVAKDIQRGNHVDYVEDEATSLRYRIYSGGEMRLPIMLENVKGAQTTGIGVLLFVDGVPQPYRLEEETEYAYLHTFYLESGTYYPDLYFIPITGQKGDKLEVWAKVVEGPEIVPTEADSIAPLYSMTAFGGGGSIIQFNATPPAQELPETADRILSQTVSRTDTTRSEVGSWSASDLMQRISAKCVTPDISAKGSASPYDRYDISEDEPIRVRFEVFGSPLVSYRLVYFLDNVPVTADAGELAFIEVESGQKTVVETVIDLTGFDGYSILYPVLVPVNSALNDAGERQPFTYSYVQSPVTFHLTGAADRAGMLKMNAADPNAAP